MTTPYGIDPEEWAAAAYDGMITGGASEAEAVAFADQQRAWLTDSARAEDTQYVLRNTTQDLRDWETELASDDAAPDGPREDTETDIDDDCDGM